MRNHTQHQTAVKTHTGNRGDHLSNLQPVQDGCFPGTIQTKDQDPHLPCAKQAREETREETTCRDRKGNVSAKTCILSVFDRKRMSPSQLRLNECDDKMTPIHDSHKKAKLRQWEQERRTAVPDVVEPVSIATATTALWGEMNNHVALMSTL